MYYIKLKIKIKNKIQKDLRRSYQNV